jgi:transcriptional regulator with PAS, ATPase and Fis domain
VLQEGTFERLGGTTTLHADVRIVAATNKNLVEAIASHHFREDLYYRINVVNIVLPPLRERPEDIPSLAAHFLRKYAEQNHKEISAIQQDALRHLQGYSWPGNVRELENVIERAVVLTQTSTVEVEHLPSHLQDSDPAPIPGERFALPIEATLAEI